MNESNCQTEIGMPASEDLLEFRRKWCYDKESSTPTRPGFRCHECPFSTYNGGCLIKEFIFHHASVEVRNRCNNIAAS